MDSDDTDRMKDSKKNLGKANDYLDKSRLCDLCNQSFDSQSKLILHFKSAHNKINPFKCDLCCKRLCNKKYLDLHTKMIHGEQNISYECEKCCKMFKSKSSRNMHFRNL